MLSESRGRQGFSFREYRAEALGAGLGGGVASIRNLTCSCVSPPPDILAFYAEAPPKAPQANTLTAQGLKKS